MIVPPPQPRPRYTYVLNPGKLRSYDSPARQNDGVAYYDIEDNHMARREGVLAHRVTLANAKRIVDAMNQQHRIEESLRAYTITSLAPGHTDLMVSPEAIDAALNLTEDATPA